MDFVVCSAETRAINITHLICAAITKHKGKFHSSVLWYLMSHGLEWLSSSSPMLLQTVAVTCGRAAF